jgi:hypothetical protein
MDDTNFDEGLIMQDIARKCFLKEESKCIEDSYAQWEFKILGWQNPVNRIKPPQIDSSRRTAKFLIDDQGWDMMHTLG